MTKLIATSQELEKYQELDLKKSSQILKVELEACLDVKLKSLILASSSSSSRDFRLASRVKSTHSSLKLDLTISLSMTENFDDYQRLKLLIVENYQVTFRFHRS